MFRGVWKKNSKCLDGMAGSPQLFEFAGSSCHLPHYKIAHFLRWRTGALESAFSRRIRLLTCRDLSPVSHLTTPDVLTKKSTIIGPSPRFFLQNLSLPTDRYFMNCILASDRHLDPGKTTLLPSSLFRFVLTRLFLDANRDIEYIQLQTHLRGGDMRMFGSNDRTVEFNHLQVRYLCHPLASDFWGINHWLSVVRFHFEFVETRQGTISNDKRLQINTQGARFSMRYLVFFILEDQRPIHQFVFPVAVYSHPSQRGSLFPLFVSALIQMLFVSFLEITQSCTMVLHQFLKISSQTVDQLTVLIMPVSPVTSFSPLS